MIAIGASAIGWLLLSLDLNLPGSDGFHILSAVRSEPRLESMPLVVISTSSREKDIAHSYQLGCNAYVVKPESASTFIEMIHAVLARSGFAFRFVRGGTSMLPRQGPDLFLMARAGPLASAQK